MSVYFFSWHPLCKKWDKPGQFLIRLKKVLILSIEFRLDSHSTLGTNLPHKWCKNSSRRDMHWTLQNVLDYWCHWRSCCLTYILNSTELNNLLDELKLNIGQKFATQVLQKLIETWHALDTIERIRLLMSLKKLLSDIVQ